MTESRERIQGIAGPPRFTGEAGETFTRVNAPTATTDGVLRELTALQIEQMTREGVIDYQQRRAKQLEQRKAQEAEASDFARYQETFVEAGGREKDAATAWEAQKRLHATEAAKHVEAEALNASRRRVQRGL